MKCIPLKSLVFSLLCFGSSLFADRVAIELLVNDTGVSIPDDFLGLSYESARILPNADGTRYFDRENRPLVNLFRTLGVKSLRVGGNSVDRTAPEAFAEQDVQRLFDFAETVGASVIYSVRLNEGNPAVARKMAGWIFPLHAKALHSFAIGNEPESYKDYALYRAKWLEIKEAMAAVAPSAKFSGPDQNPKPEFYAKIAADLGKQGHLSYLTGHSYPADCSYKNPSAKTIAELQPVDAEQARAKLLSREIHAVYEKVRENFVGSAEAQTMPFRLSETNSLWYGGLKDASDTQAAALWAVDYLYWWASHGACGINFHTGDLVGGGDKILPSRYTAFVTTAKGYEVRPLGYAMKLFSLGGRGRLLKVQMAETEQLQVYATKTPDASIMVTLINKASGPSAGPQDLRVTLPKGTKLAKAEQLALVAPGNDPAAKTGLLLGGARISEEGEWGGAWTDVPVSEESGLLLRGLAPASVTLLRLSLR